MTHANASLRHRWWLAGLAAVLLSACVHRIDIQQGNLLDEEDVDQVEVGMTRSQVRFLLGTPVVRDPFHTQRWDYVFHLRRGRSRNVESDWLIVHFEGDTVSAIERNVELQPRRAGFSDS